MAIGAYEEYDSFYFIIYHFLFGFILFYFLYFTEIRITITPQAVNPVGFQHIGPEDFELLKVLGKGGYGKVSFAATALRLVVLLLSGSRAHEQVRCFLVGERM